LLVYWEKLDEKEQNRQMVRQIPKLLAVASFEIYKLI